MRIFRKSPNPPGEEDIRQVLNRSLQDMGGKASFKTFEILLCDIVRHDGQAQGRYGKERDMEPGGGTVVQRGGTSFKNQK